MIGFILKPFDVNIKLSYIATQLGVPEITYHKLRHSFATMGLNAGVSPRDMAKILGHKQVSTTINLYWTAQKEVEINFNPIALFHHYKSMCKQNYLKYLKSGHLVTYKKYLYAMRGLVNSKWIINNEGLPPIQFPETIKKVKGVPVYVLQRLLDIIKIKKVGK